MVEDGDGFWDVDGVVAGCCFCEEEEETGVLIGGEED